MSPFRRTNLSGSRIVIKLISLALILISTAPARAQTPVEAGDTITEPGLYYLDGNQYGDGITINSDDVTLLLLRFRLRGDGSGTGIRSNGYDNIVIYGGRVTEFEVGIDLIASEYCTVKDVRIDHCLYNGLQLRGARENWALRVQADHNGEEGVVAINCSETRFTSIRSYDNGHDGILIRNVDGVVAAGEGGPGNNKVKLCWAAYNDLDGIRILDSDDNEITRNQCVNNTNAGIRLDTNVDQASDAAQGLDGADENELESNWCVFNDAGIVVEWSSTGNTLTNNTALANHDDMVDNNDGPPCENTWFLNFFFFRDGAGAACIF